MPPFKMFFSYFQALKNEAQLMVDMVACLDAFTGQRTRMVSMLLNFFFHRYWWYKGERLARPKHS